MFTARAEIPLFIASILLHSGTLLPAYRNEGVACKALGEQTKALMTFLGGKGKGFFGISCYPQGPCPSVVQSTQGKSHS